VHPSADEPSTATADPRAWVQLGVLAALIVAWFVLIQRFGEGDVYSVLGPFACAVCAVSIAIDPRAMLRWLAPSARAVLVGVGVGLIMTALTYPVFRLAVAIDPSLDTQVEVLYIGVYSTTLPRALAWVVSIILAEELLFRGVWPATLQRWLPARAAYLVSLGAYALAQYGTGSWIVMAMAGVCGSIWTLQRMYTDSLLSPLIAHLIWSPIVILLYPVT
jgi:membrane protease YdiL (CAAX protease family)